MSYLRKKSFNEKIFQEAVPRYRKALQNSDYKHTLTYKHLKNYNNSTNINKIKRNRKRQIIFTIKLKDENKNWQIILKSFR